MSTVLALGLLLTACGSGEDEAAPPAPKCDGTLSPAAVEAVASVLGTEKYQESGLGVGRTTDALIADQAREGRPPGHPATCEIVTDASPRKGLGIDVWLHDADALYDDGTTKWWNQGRYLYAMGREASTDNQLAYLFVQCTSPLLKGSDKRPAPVGASLAFDKPAKGAYPENTTATREAYLTVLHSVALGVVKKLECENNAGLPDRPVLETRKWRGQP
ncbi:hypothetical protein AB0G79_05950 [Streptomyces sp. NPDC020807]|uniref:hypothetical protein n=1 Tax=Streptomyces sp. NPDC020807 TaxID=3155119 RepID=UPI0033D7E98C